MDGHSHEAISAECDRNEAQITALWTKGTSRLVTAACYVGAYLEVSPAPGLLEGLRFLLDHRDVLDSWGVDGEPLEDLSEAELFMAFAHERITTARYYLLEATAQRVGFPEALEIAATALELASEAISYAYTSTKRN